MLRGPDVMLMLCLLCNFYSAHLSRGSSCLSQSLFFLAIDKTQMCYGVICRGDL